MPGYGIHREVLIDTNVLLVYFVGIYDRAYGRNIIARFRFTKGTYSPGDFRLLTDFLEQFDRLTTTPQILTEVSNMLGYLSGDAREVCLNIFKETIPSLEENTVPSIILAQNPEFVRFGITDTSILEAAQKPCLILTDDFKLSNFLTHSGMSAINFDHIRSQYGSK